MGRTVFDRYSRAESGFVKVLVTGATGFIGRHLLPRLLAHGHEVSVIIRNLDKLKSFDWHRQVRLIEADIETIDTH